MAFVCEKIETIEDKEYFKSIGFTDITGRLIEEPYVWAIDRERNMILVPRGGGGLEMPEGYALYLNGKIIELEGTEILEGSKLKNNLKIHWVINKIILQEKDGYNELNEIIKEAFSSYAYRIRKPSQVLEVSVEIESKENNRGEQL